MVSSDDDRFGEVRFQANPEVGGRAGPRGRSAMTRSAVP